MGSHVSGPIAVFGGSGFLGRRIVERLAAAGEEVRVGVRHPERASFRPEAGRIEPVRADVWDESTVARAVEGAASAINCVGHYVERRGATFHGIHGQGALHVARQAKRAGVQRLVHISGLGADPGSDSPYVRARGIGEGLVGEAFEGVAILRPSVIVGPGDAFLNRLAGLARQSPVMPLFGTGGTRLQPVFVGDVAEACASVLADPATEGRVYEIGGPRVYAYGDLVRSVVERIGRRPAMIPVPFPVWHVLAAAMALHPDPPLTRDQVKLMGRDNVVGEGALTLTDLGIRPTPLEEVLAESIAAGGRLAP